ncbi:MAG TPA: hypothetical protein VK586_14775, partial [Streptosporangiaceae bacterium]|nr:hypothetical protein [Streptosporangiaceae bacterium]
MATITLRVQWALWGTEAGGSGYHQLACSAGEISRDAVDWVVTRYLPGTPHAGPHSWPQVTIGWLRDDSLGDCLAVGIHDRAVPDAAGPGAVDAHGRTVTRARLYYVRFPDAARSRVSYSDLYEALSAVRLPAASPEPVRADLAVRPGPAPAPAEFALRVAALLLSGYPVCVLGAEDLTVTERLGFLDAVASLLPYGMRARLSVSTWAGSTAAHRFRLFFAAVPRSGAEDIAVAWDQAGTVPNAGGACAAYLSWLREDTVRRVEQLA